MYIHDLNPILINFGFFEVRWYSLAYIAGILVGWWIAKKIIIYKIENKTVIFDVKIFDDLISYIIISIIIGGRLGYIIFYNSSYYFDNPLDVFKIWQGGMSFHGGLLGIIVSCTVYSHIKSISILTLTDLIASAAPIGLFFGRIANFINGELYGNETSLLWGVIFPNTNMIPRHPTQIYEALLEGIVLFLILKISINKYHSLKYPGIISSLFLIYYSIFRIFIEFFRMPDPHIGYITGPLTTGMILSIPMLAIGLYLYIKIKTIK